MRLILLSVAVLAAFAVKKSEENSAQNLLDDLLPENEAEAGNWLEDGLQELPLSAIEEETLNSEKYEPALKPHFTESVGRGIALPLEAVNQRGHRSITKMLAFTNLLEGNIEDIEEIKKTFEELSLIGSSDAQFGLGFLYSTGTGVLQDQNKAIIYYTFSALGGNPMAQMTMAYRHYYGIGVAKDCHLAMEYYYRAAKTVIDRYGFTTPPTEPKIRLTDDLDPDVQKTNLIITKEELDFYKFNSKGGDTTLIRALGLLHLTGSKGVPQDYDLAKQYFEQAETEGDVVSTAFLGKMYLDGTPATPARNSTAFAMFYKAAQQGDLTAICALGHMYIFGIGVHQNIEKAMGLFDYGVERGSATANLYLGYIYEIGDSPHRYKIAAKHYKVAAHHGELLAVFNLANLHRRGAGVPQSCKIATELFKQTAEHGEWPRKFLEAFLAYEKGIHSKASMIYLFLAEMGFEVAQLNYAHMLEQRMTNETNIENKAFLWWQRAAQQGSVYARNKLGDYYYYGLGVVRNVSMALEHYKYAAINLKSPRAFFNLGLLHQYGEGVLKDFHMANKYFDMVLEYNSQAYYPVGMAKLKLRFDQWITNIVELFKWLDSILFEGWDLVVCVLILTVLFTGAFLRSPVRDF